MLLKASSGNVATLIKPSSSEVLFSLIVELTTTPSSVAIPLTTPTNRLASMPLIDESFTRLTFTLMTHHF